LVWFLGPLQGKDDGLARPGELAVELRAVEELSKSPSLHDSEQ
jgi:hypothetical protein